MQNEFLRRLFFACSAEKSTVLEADLKLSELYKRIEAALEALNAFNDALEDAGLDFDVADEITNACCNVADAYEMQGFINGFRLGMLLAGEIQSGGKEEHVCEGTFT